MAETTTLLIAEDCAKLAQIMNIKYAAARAERFFSMASRVEGGVVFLSVLLENRDQNFYYPVESRVNFKEQNLDAKDAALLLADYIDAYFEDYFREDENVFLPIEWSDFEFEGVNLQLKGQVLNLYSEREADRLLGLTPS